MKRKTNVKSYIYQRINYKTLYKIEFFFYSLFSIISIESSPKLIKKYHYIRCFKISLLCWKSLDDVKYKMYIKSCYITWILYFKDWAESVPGCSVSGYYLRMHSVESDRSSTIHVCPFTFNLTSLFQLHVYVYAFNH